MQRIINGHRQNKIFRVFFSKYEHDQRLKQNKREVTQRLFHLRMIYYFCKVSINQRVNPNSYLQMVPFLKSNSGEKI